MKPYPTRMTQLLYIYMNLLGTIFFVCNHLDLHTGMGLENDDSCDKGIYI